MNKALKITLIIVVCSLCVLGGLLIYGKVLKQNSNNEAGSLLDDVEIVKLDSRVKLIGNSNIKEYCVKDTNEKPNESDKCFNKFDGDEAIFEVLEGNYYIWVKDEKGNISNSIIINDYNKELVVQEDGNIEGLEEIKKDTQENNKAGISGITPTGTDDDTINVTYNYNLFDSSYRKSQGLTINYNPTYQIIEINGTWTGKALTLGNLLNVRLKNGERYNVILNYVSGSYETNETSNPRFIFELQRNETNLSPRSKVEMSLPLEDKKISILSINGDNINANGFRFWMYENETDVTTFKNYKIQVFITKEDIREVNLNSTYGEQPVPEKAGYRFLGWHGSLKGNDQVESDTQLIKNESHTLYAHWEKGVLSIKYDGNDGTWNNPIKNVYGVNSTNIVIVKSTNNEYTQQLNYDGQLDSNGLVDYNGAWFNWKKSGYTVESGKEYFIENGSQKVELDQNKAYTAKELASYAGCDLSKQNCTIIVKVNWKINGWSIYTDYGQGSWIYHDASKNELRRYYNSSYGLLPFMEYVPEKVVSSGDSVPLIIWLHGKGEIGSTAEKLEGTGLPKVVNEWNKTGLKNIPAIIVAPHLTKGITSWSKFEEPAETIRALVYYAKAKYNINPNKVILIGHSLGGSGVEGISPKNQDLFSALVVMSGYFSGVSTENKLYYTNIPMKGYSEPKDSGNPPVETGTLMYHFFEGSNHLKDLTIYPNASHGGVPKLALTEDKNNDKISDLIYWALSQNKKSD